MSDLSEYRAAMQPDAEPEPMCVKLCATVARLRRLLREWTDMDPLRYDTDGSACPWCYFDYSRMRHEPDCPFVLARAECGIDKGDR